jgi:hypothetical protein
METSLVSNKNNMSTHEKLYLVSFFHEFGRSGELDGLFVTTQEKLMASIGKLAYFGEVLGKHSEVELRTKEEDYEIKSEDQDFIAKLVELLGTDISGFNPLDYVDHNSVEEVDEDDEE